MPLFLVHHHMRIANYIALHSDYSGEQMDFVEGKNFVSEMARARPRLTIISQCVSTVLVLDYCNVCLSESLFKTASSPKIAQRHLGMIGCMLVVWVCLGLVWVLVTESSQGKFQRREYPGLCREAICSPKSPTV
jgi:hypothetical protein